jgi:thiopeptide-type bacteriocin biosynthesis protein
MNENVLEHFSFAMLRAPLQSLQNAYRLCVEPSPMFCEGLYLSSPEFWREFQKAGLLPVNEKMERSFSKYWLRSCTRCTPYGTFAGTAMANITDDETSLIVSGDRQHSRHVRIGMNYMADLVFSLLKMPLIRGQIRFFVNNSLYDASDSWRYAEYTIRNQVRNYHLSSVEKTGYMKAILDRAKTGATIGDLSSLLMNLEEVDENEAGSFIISLCESQILISELEPCVTGKEPFSRLIEQLSTLKGLDDLVCSLFKIEDQLQRPQAGIACYEAIETGLKNLCILPEDSRLALQTDLSLTMECCNINSLLIDNIMRQASDLMILARKNNNPELEDFKKKFHSRYEDAEIPLSIALDADLGIGYAGINDDAAGRGVLINDLDLPRSHKNQVAETDHITQLAQDKYRDYLKNGKIGIELTEDDLKRIRGKTDKYKFPGSMFLMGSLMKKNGKFDENEFLFDLPVFGGPSAANLFGRFTTADDQLCQATKEILKQEELEDKNCIYAEIAHLPQARIGNVLLRPVLRNYEIPYVGRSGAADGNQITVDDITICIRDNEVVLWSRKWGKRIIPRLTTAHNFGSDSLPVYKFLCDLQMHGLAFPNVWDWGSLETAEHLPRVTYKNIVIRKARWRIEENELQELPAGISEHAPFLDNFCMKREIPFRVVYKEGDNGLLIDFRERTGRELFLYYLRQHKTIFIEEALFTEENCIVKDEKGAPFNNELIIPVKKRSRAGEMGSPAFPERRDHSFVKRKYPVCSEWLYFKIYCGSTTAERILKRAVLPFVEEGILTGLFEKFFFVRYKDEFPHLRIRFFNTDTGKQLAVQKAFIQVMQPYMDHRLVDKIVLDTYCRELERYGAGLIAEAEELFHNDSLAVLRFLSLLEEGGKHRILFALRGIDTFLNDFKLALRDKTELVGQMQAGYFKEFGGQPGLQRQLNDKYRKYQEIIFSNLDSRQDGRNEIEDAVAIFSTRSDMNAIIADRILSQGIARQELFLLLASHIHMFMNRMFVAQQRKYELVVYHFMHKYLNSKMAIEKAPRPELYPN